MWTLPTGHPSGASKKPEPPAKVPEGDPVVRVDEVDDEIEFPEDDPKD